MDLLQGYSSESDSESRTGSESEEPNSLPELPVKLLDKYHIAPSTNLEMNANRLKGFLWTSFIYLDWRLTSRDRRIFTEYVIKCNNQCKPYGIEFKPLFYSDFGTPLNLHVTLSPNLQFSSEQTRNLFFSTLQETLKNSHIASCQVPLQRGAMLLRAPEGHSTFLTLPVDPLALQEYILPLHNAVASTCKAMDITLSPSFSISKSHVSLARTWAEVPPKLSTILPPLDCHLAIPENHRVQYDRNRESLTLHLFPKRK